MVVCTLLVSPAKFIRQAASNVAHLLAVVLGCYNSRRSKCISAQQLAPPAALTHGQRNEIIHQAPSHDPVAGRSTEAETDTCQNLDQGGWCFVDKVRDGCVVEEVKNADAGECLGNDVREDR